MSCVSSSGFHYRQDSYDMAVRIRERERPTEAADSQSMPKQDGKMVGNMGQVKELFSFSA